MKNTMIKIFALLAISIVITACGDEVSWGTQESNRAMAIENAKYNMKSFTSNSPEYSSWGIDMAGDSTIGPKCAQGDGWASLKLVNKLNPKHKIKVKCSTVSGTIGCMLQKDFDTKSYARQDGSCNHDIPKILPKILK